VPPAPGSSLPENALPSNENAWPGDRPAASPSRADAAPALWPEALALTSVLLLVSLLLTGWLRPADLWPF
jgi:hypothetical protein